MFGPIEARDELARVVQMQALDDLAPRRRIGRGGERDARHVGKAFVQDRELPVLRTEIVAPLRDAVRLVNGEQRDGHLRHLFEEPLGQQTLRRDVQQLQLAREHASFDVALRERIETRIQECRFDAKLPQRGDLILHQRDQW